METNVIPETAGARVLIEADLDAVVGGAATSQIWVSPMAIHGFNPQPDPPAFGSLRMIGAAVHA